MSVGISFLALFLAVASAAAQSPESFEQIAKKADAARTADRLNDAIHLYRQGLHLRPSWADGWWSLASLYYEQDRFPEAEDSFRHFAALTPKKGPADAFLGLCEYETRDYDRALRHFRAWASAGWPGTPELQDVAVFHFALLLTREGEFVRSLYLLAPEAAKVGDNPALSEAMGLASLRMRNVPEDYPPERREMVWLAGQAALYAAQSPHDFARADHYAERLVLRYPQQPDVHYFRGTLFTFAKNPADAEREYREELRISPQHVPAMLALAEIDLTNNQLAEAEYLARRSVDLDPKNPEAHHTLGRVLMAKGHLDESVRELETAKQLAPDSATIRSHLAMAYGRLGRSKEAKTEAAAYQKLKAHEGVLAPPHAKLSAGMASEQNP